MVVCDCTRDYEEGREAEEMHGGDCRRDQNSKLETLATFGASETNNKKDATEGLWETAQPRQQAQGEQRRVERARLATAFAQLKDQDRLGGGIRPRVGTQQSTSACFAS